MPFINKKTDKKSDSKNRFKKRDDKEDDSDKKKKFDDKPAPSDEDDDSSRGKPNFKNKFKKGDDKDDDNKDRFKGRDDKDDDDEDDDDKDRFGKKKKKNDDQDVTKDPDRAGDDDDTGPSDGVDKKRGDRDEDDDDGKSKKSKGGCNCGRQIEVNPPLRTQYEAIEALPPSLQADAVAALAEQETEKILSALAEKAEDHGVDFDILFEVFRRGWMGSPRGWSHLTEAEIGFNRVNSFLAGGLARRLDADLQEDTIGTDNLVCDHDEPTPGEKLKSKLRKRKP